jgi:hypothetical protein
MTKILFEKVGDGSAAVGRNRQHGEVDSTGAQPFREIEQRVPKPLVC